MGKIARPTALNVIVVAEYRAFFVGRDGHLSGFEPLICATDAEVIEQAHRLVDGHDIELWSGVRLVTQLKRKPTEVSEQE